jgi:phosphoglycerol transferase MdoB-like AlkP superfamily enzyme
METDYDAFIRVVAFAVGMWTAVHYFLGANALEKAPHWVKLVLFPALVVNGVAICFASVVYGAGMVFLVSAPLIVLLSIKDYMIWSAGAYMSAVLDRQARMKEQMRQAYNRYRSDLTTPYENVADIVTPSGFDVIQQTERTKESA